MREELTMTLEPLAAKEKCAQIVSVTPHEIGGKAQAGTTMRP
jgi:hypothetical protein